MKWVSSTSKWTPSADNDTDTTYTAGRGIDLNGTTFRLGLDGVRTRRTTTQSLTNATLTAIQFGVEDYDTATYHDNSTNNTRLTVPQAGKYLISGCIEFAANATGVRTCGIRLNGSTYVASQGSSSMGSVLTTVVNVTTVLDLAASDYVELIGYQSSGGALNVQGSQMTNFSATWLV